MSRACWRISRLRLFETVDDGKLCPPNLRGNINRSIKFINCAMFPENKTWTFFSTLHHQEIPRRNGICSVAWLPDRSWEVKIVYLFFQENTSRKFLNLLLFYFLTANIVCICHYFRWMSWLSLKSCKNWCLTHLISGRLGGTENMRY